MEEMLRVVNARIKKARKEILVLLTKPPRREETATDETCWRWSCWGVVLAEKAAAGEAARVYVAEEAACGDA